MTRAVELSNPEYHLDAPGPTFAGRDVFAPAAAHLCNGVDLAELGEFVDPNLLMPGIIPVTQSATTLRALAAAVAAYDPMSLTALHAITTTSGSLVIALAVLEGELDAEGAFGASQLDESFQIEQWGEDYEAAERRAALKADIGAAARFVALLRS